MDITKMLESDHREAEKLISQIRQADGAERAPLIEELTKALQGHMQIEEDVVYPHLKSVTGEESVREANTEHDLVRTAIDDMVKLGPDEPGFGAALDVLEAGVAHHVEDEESDVFPKLRADGKKELEEMATPFMQKRVELGMEIKADAIAASFTKDELVAEAKAAGLSGADGMKKEEIAEMLADAMAS